VWTTDKDGLIMELLAAEITARTTKNPGEHYRELIAGFGAPCSIDAPPTTEHKARPKTLWPEAVEGIEFAGEPILAQLSHAPHNNAPVTASR
jgi:phosphoglucomutase